MSEAIVTRIDEMGDRIDGLEKSIGDLMNQAGVQSDEPGAASSSSNTAHMDTSQSDLKNEPEAS